MQCASSGPKTPSSASSNQRRPRAEVLVSDSEDDEGEEEVYASHLAGAIAPRVLDSQAEGQCAGQSLDFGGRVVGGLLAGGGPHVGDAGVGGRVEVGGLCAGASGQSVQKTGRAT